MENIRGFFDENGHLNDYFTAFAVDYLKNSGKTILPEEVSLHIESCSKCKDKVLDIFSTLIYRDTDRLNSKEILELPLEKEKRDRKNRRYYIRSAAAFFFLTIFSAVYIFIINDSSIFFKTSGKEGKKPLNNLISSGPEIKKGHTRPEKKKDKKIRRQSRVDPLLNFRNNPNLELMVNSTFRGRMIHIISPEFKQPEKRKIVFKWENHIDKKLKLKILNNRNETIHILEVKGSSATFNGMLDPGLYYWKLEDTEDLYHVGKFLIGPKPNGRKV